MRDSVIYPKDEVLGFLLRCYSTPGRVYHVWDHVIAMLDRYKNMVDKGWIIYDPAQVYAMWFHDAVYSPLRDDNETESAYMAFEYLSSIMGIDERTAGETQEIILDTAPPYIALNPKSGIVHDLDFFVFLLNGTLYKQYVAQVREEYKHMPDKVWWGSRLDFLTKFLNREHLFYTPQIIKQEHRAIANIKTEIAQIKQNLGIQ